MPRRFATLSWYRRHRLTIGYVLLCLAVAALFVRAYQLAHEGTLAHRALCAQQQDLRNRIRQSELFLTLTMDERIKRFGPVGAVPNSVIRVQLVSQRRTLAAYRGLEC